MDTVGDWRTNPPSSGNPTRYSLPQQSALPTLQRYPTPSSATAVQHQQQQTHLLQPPCPSPMMLHRSPSGAQKKIRQKKEEKQQQQRLALQNSLLHPNTTDTQLVHSSWTRSPALFTPLDSVNNANSEYERPSSQASSHVGSSNIQATATSFPNAPLVSLHENQLYPPNQCSRSVVEQNGYQSILPESHIDAVWKCPLPPFIPSDSATNTSRELPNPKDWRETPNGDGAAPRNKTESSQSSFAVRNSPEGKEGGEIEERLASKWLDDNRQLDTLDAVNPNHYSHVSASMPLQSQSDSSIYVQPGSYYFQQKPIGQVHPMPMPRTTLTPSPGSAASTSASTSPSITAEGKAVEQQLYKSGHNNHLTTTRPSAMGPPPPLPPKKSSMLRNLAPAAPIVHSRETSGGENWALREKFSKSLRVESPPQSVADKCEELMKERGAKEMERAKDAPLTEMAERATASKVEAVGERMLMTREMNAGFGSKCYSEKTKSSSLSNLSLAPLSTIPLHSYVGSGSSGLSSIGQSTDSLPVLLCGGSPSLLSLQNSLSNAASNPEHHTAEQLEELESRRLRSIESLSHKATERQLDLQAVCDELNSIDDIRLSVFKSLQGNDRLLARLTIQLVQAERLVELETRLQLQLEKLVLLLPSPPGCTQRPNRPGYNPPSSGEPTAAGAEAVTATEYDLAVLETRRERLMQQREDALLLRAGYESRDAELEWELEQRLPTDVLLEWRFYKTNMMKLTMERKQLEEKLRAVNSQLKCLEVAAPSVPKHQRLRLDEDTSPSVASSIDSKCD